MSRAIHLGPAAPISALVSGAASRVVIPGAGRRLWAPPERPGELYIESRSPLGRLHVREDIKLPLNVRAEGWIDAEEQDILDYWFANVALTNLPSHIGLYTTTPADTGAGGVEVSGGSYAREALARNATNWPAASGTAPASIDNGVAVTFTTATANWGTVASWGYFDAISAGNLTFFAVLTTAKAVDNGDTASFAIGDMTGQLGDPGDSY